MAAAYLWMRVITPDVVNAVRPPIRPASVPNAAANWSFRSFQRGGRHTA